MHLPHLRLLTTAVTLAAFGLSALISSAAPASATARPTGTHEPDPLVHVMPMRAAPPATPGAPLPPITYHGGPIMTGDVHVYAIWYGLWSKHTFRRALLTDFLGHLPSPYFEINRTYPNAAGKTVTGVTFAGQAVDPGSVGRVNLTDVQIRQVVESTIAAGRLPRDTRGIYLIITSPEVTKLGFLTQYCGWHTYTVVRRTSIKYAFIGDPSGPDLRLCAPQSTSPNGDAAGDAMASVIAHEVSEAVTDPTLRGWFDATGAENADRCAWNYGTPHRVAGALTNVRLGQRNYYIQANWLNRGRGGCAMSG